jgi:hypothetical protein
MPRLAGAGVDAVYGFGDFAEAGSLGATVIQRGTLCHVGISADSELVRPSVSLPGLLTAALEELGTLAERFARGGRQYARGVRRDSDY